MLLENPNLERGEEDAGVFLGVYLGQPLIAPIGLQSQGFIPIPRTGQGGVILDRQ